MTVKHNHITFYNDSIRYDDQTLVALFYKAQEDIMKKQSMFEKRQTNRNEHDYLSYAIARLAYEFAKEEHDVLYKEVKKRGLITQ